MKRQLSIFIFAFMLFGCFDNPTTSNNNITPLTEISSPPISNPPPLSQIKKTSIDKQNTPLQQTSPLFKHGFDKDDYPISIREISPTDFEKLTHGNPNFSISFMPLDDLKSVKKLLKGIMDFNSDGSIKRIHFKNGGVIDNPEGRFVAYYAYDDDNKNILVLEGGHSSDISYNLNTGKSTEHVGNPNQASISSPNKQYRLIGHFGGQECSSYFIQKRINGEWVKIIEFNDIFNALIPPDEHSSFGLYYYNGSVFLNESHAYIVKQRTDDNNQEHIRVYEITLKDDPTFKKSDIDIKTQSLSDNTNINIDVNFDNYQDIIPKNGYLNKEQAKFFAGLYPNAQEIYVLGLYHYQKDIKSYVVSMKQNRDLLQTYLINIDKNHHIIDSLLISTYGIREFDFDITAILQKEQIKVVDNNGNEPNEVIYRVDDKGYFYTPRQ